MTVSGSSPSPRSLAAELGATAEELVALWLVSQGWEILHRRWRCRCGELDLVAYVGSAHPVLAFVEVKARSSGSWDANGLLAVTPKKQIKLRKTAQLFLSLHPALSEVACRFDVALVRGTRSPSTDPLSSFSGQGQIRPLVPQMAPQMGRSRQLGHYRLTLQHYLPGAFE